MKLGVNVMIGLFLLNVPSIQSASAGRKSKITRESFSQQVGPAFARAHVRGIVDTYSHQIQEHMSKLRHLYVTAHNQINNLSLTDAEKKEALDAIVKNIDLAEILKPVPLYVSPEQAQYNKRLYDVLTASSRSLESVETALVAGADPNGYIAGIPILFSALKKWESDQLTDLFKLFKRHGFKSDLKTENGRTLLEYAFVYKSSAVPAIIAVFPEIDVNTPDNEGNTALHYAARNKGYEHIPALLKLGAAINRRNNSGETPLIVAGKWRSKTHLHPNASAIGLLIKHGADPLEVDNAKKTVRDYVLENEQLTKEIDMYTEQFKHKKAASSQAASSLPAQ